MGSSQQLAKVKITGVSVGNAMISPSARMRDLGVELDTEITMVCHVKTVFRAVCYQIRMIGRDTSFPLPADL